MARLLKRHQGAGKSAETEYERLKKAWQRRMFRRLRFVVWPVLILAFVAATFLPGAWETFGITLVGCAWIGWWIVNELLPPDHIQRWQRGAWGEQYVAKSLRPLKSEGWVVLHDLPNGRGNRDHVVAGPAIYLLDTKNHAHDELTIEGEALRVRRIDQPRDSYILDRLTPAMRRAAAGLSAEITRGTGERVFVYPVVVLIGWFDAQAQETGGVFYVEKDHLVEWLRSRPIDLHNRRREVVTTWLRNLESGRGKHEGERPDEVPFPTPV